MLLACAILLVALLLAGCESSSVREPGPQRPVTARPLLLGFSDSLFRDRDGALRGPWLDRAHEAGATRVRLEAQWSEIAPNPRPAGFAARDHADPAYTWETVDASVRDAAARDLGVLLIVAVAPAWAQAPGRPGEIPIGAWRPDPVALGDFAHALARRYSGTAVDPKGRKLPRVGAFEVWNEPNLDVYLAPQWTRRNDDLVRDGPGHFRRMLRAFGDAAHGVHADNVVVSGGLSPFGDAGQGAARTPPAAFLRAALCLDADLRARSGCAQPVPIDAIGHHPYNVGGPRRSARNPDDVSIPDLGRLRRVIGAARRAGTIADRPLPIWVTELAYDSSPPDPDGVPAARHATWVAESLEVLARQGVRDVFWFRLRDEPPVPAYDVTYQSGFYLLDGAPKAALATFRFPLTVTSRDAGVRLWTRPPASGDLVVERRTASGWHRAASASATEGVPVTLLVTDAGTALRARVGAATSEPIETR